MNDLKIQQNVLHNSEWFKDTTKTSNTIVNDLKIQQNVLLTQ